MRIYSGASERERIPFQTSEEEEEEKLCPSDLRLHHAGHVAPRLESDPPQFLVGRATAGTKAPAPSGVESIPEQAQWLLDHAAEEKPEVAYQLPNEPFLRISVLKSNVDLSKITTEYVVTPRGMVGSLRRGATGDITIGRQQLTEDGTRPNDIMRTAADRAISRTHCKIIYKHGFHSGPAMSEGFLEFLKLFSARGRAPAATY